MDPEQPDLISRVNSDFRHRGYSPLDEPPFDRDVVESVIAKRVSKDAKFTPHEEDEYAGGEFVYYEDAPAPVVQVRPIYPELAHEAKVEGRVVLHVLVGKDGCVRNVKVIRSVTMLDQAAIDAVRQWVFKPALANNKPVAVWVEVPVDFPPK